MDKIKKRLLEAPATTFLVILMLLGFAAMVTVGGASISGYSSVQLVWGANFAPATQDGEWWRLISAIFLHFGIWHLMFNTFALWDAGLWVERFYGHVRFLLIFVVTGITGNLLSLAIHSASAVSAGASGGIFGIYGALISFFWFNRNGLVFVRYRWLFIAAGVFSVFTILVGLFLEGIDNAAHVGGWLSGMVLGAALERPGKQRTGVRRSVFGLLFAVGLLVMIRVLPEPPYHWSDEIQVQQAIDRFLRGDEQISSEWNQLMSRESLHENSFDSLAGQIESDVVHYYEESFEQLSELPGGTELPSSEMLERLQTYALSRRNASRKLADGLRARNPDLMREALREATEHNQ